MAVIKPYTFVAGTKAKAAEVNEDFDVLYTEVNALGSTVVDYQSQIEQLASEKANVNGNYANRFSVANPTTNYDAVNKQTLFNTIGNSLPYIYGLGITKVGDNTISVAAGECYDTTETTLLKLSGNLEKQNQTQAASSSYYVYIIGGANVNEDILISTLSLDPNLPDGYTLSRRIGSYTTDSNNKILQTTNEQVSQYTTNQIYRPVEIYTNGNSWRRVYSDGWCEQGSQTGSFGTDTDFSITYTLPFKNINYYINGVIINSTGGWERPLTYIKTKRTDGSTWRCNRIEGTASGTRNFIWYACGYVR